ncbi:MAG: excalibur calcium-binding domain-containing protein [Sphingorhabdus sp.]
MARDSLFKLATPLVGLTFLAVYNFPIKTEEEKVQPKAVEQSVHYSGCNEVRAAGKAPLFAGQPGYREGMDGDGDGIACEPYRGQY